MLEHHTSDTQLLLFMLCCQDRDVSTGKKIEGVKLESNGDKNSLKALTLGLYSERIKVLTESNLKYTMFLRRMKEEGKELKSAETDWITRDNFWMLLIDKGNSDAEAFKHLCCSSVIPTTFAMYNQTIMVSSLD